MFQKMTKNLPFVVFKRTFWDKVCHDSLRPTCEILLNSVFSMKFVIMKCLFQLIIGNFSRKKTPFSRKRVLMDFLYIIW